MRRYQWQNGINSSNAHETILARMRELNKLRQGAKSTGGEIDAEWARLLSAARQHGLNWNSLLKKSADDAKEKAEKPPAKKVERPLALANEPPTASRRVRRGASLEEHKNNILCELARIKKTREDPSATKEQLADATRRMKVINANAWKKKLDWTELLNGAGLGGRRQKPIEEHTQEIISQLMKIKRIREDPNSPKKLLTDTSKRLCRLHTFARSKGLNGPALAQQVGVPSLKTGRRKHKWNADDSGEKDLKNAVERMRELNAIQSNQIMSMQDVRRARNESSALRYFLKNRGTAPPGRVYETRYENPTIEAKNILLEHPHFALPNAIEALKKRMEKLDGAHMRLLRLQHDMKEISREDLKEEVNNAVSGLELAQLVVQYAGKDRENLKPGLNRIAHNVKLNYLQGFYHAAKIRRLQEICASHGLTPTQALKNVLERGKKRQ